VTAYNDPVRFGTYQPDYQQQQHMFKMEVKEGVAHFMSQIPIPMSDFRLLLTVCTLQLNPPLLPH